MAVSETFNPINSKPIDFMPVTSGAGTRVQAKKWVRASCTDSGWHRV